VALCNRQPLPSSLVLVLPLVLVRLWRVCTGWPRTGGPGPGFLPTVLRLRLRLRHLLLLLPLALLALLLTLTVQIRLWLWV
jgi:hypothetical protein